MELVGTAAVALAVFCLCMAVFGGSLLTPRRLDAIRAVALPRQRYERLVSDDQPLWERILSPVAVRLAARAPAFASQVSERDIIRAGFDPHVLTPAEVYAAKVVLAAAILAVGVALTPLFSAALLVALPIAFVGYVFPTEYLASRAKARQAQIARELPDFLALVRPLAAKHGLEHAVADVADALHEASAGGNLLARQIRGAVAAYGTGTDLYAALRDVAAASDIEALDELAAALAQSRKLGKGVGETLGEHERSLRDAERNRLIGAASTVQPKLAAILAGIYLPAFVLLIVVPLFASTLGRI
jgi:Flp pilus assembly protein TadB